MGRLTLELPTELGDTEGGKRRSLGSRGWTGAGREPTMVRWVETWAL